MKEEDDCMRQWQVGDPVGDGNDIGVPDTRYMGYQRNSEDSEYELVEDFKSDINNSRYFFNNGKYEKAFTSLKMAFKEYNKMSSIEKSYIRDEPFNQDWIVELCCRTVNKHDSESLNAIDILKEHPLPVIACDDCTCLYPAYYSCCTRCGKDLKKLRKKTPEEVAEEIPDAVRGMVFDEGKIQRLVDRSLKLMKSNDCRLVSIEDGMNWDTDFIFEKEHRYFKTTYACAYNPNYYGPLIFEEFGVTHDHDRLLADESFKRLVNETEKKTGFKFKECSGGFGSQLDDDGYDFIFNDKISVTIHFDMGDGRTAVYDIDLDKMKLGNEYRIY